MATFHFVVSAVPYYFNCTGCGKPLMVEGDVRKTDALRISGICDTCLESRLRRIFKRLRTPVFPPMPVDVRRN